MDFWFIRQTFVADATVVSLGPLQTHTMNHPENRNISEDPSLQDAALWCQPWKQLCRTRPEWIFDYLQYRLGRIGNTLYKTLKLKQEKTKKEKGTHT